LYPRGEALRLSSKSCAQLADFFLRLREGLGKQLFPELLAITEGPREKGTDEIAGF
jgi:hypothetical protein